MSELRRFPNVATSVTEARHYVAHLLAALPADTVESATLMVSELASNCIRHAHAGFTVEVGVTSAQVHVEVADDGNGRPSVRIPEMTETSGRGLRIIEILSSEWGVSDAPAPPGKSVWFTLPLAAPA